MGSGALRTRSGAASARGKLSPGPGRTQEQVAASQLERIHRATIALTAESGYAALKVRDIVRRAELSTRAYYLHFDSKDDCFLQSYDRVTRGALRRIATSQGGEPDWRKRARCMLDQLLVEIESDSDAAQLVLLDARTATPAALERTERTERRSAELLRECLALPPHGVTVPLPIAQGMVAGTLGLVRRCLAAGRVAHLREIADELAAWALTYVDRSALCLADLDRESVWRNTALETQGAPRAFPNGSSPSADNRNRLLEAVADLVATEGYAAATVSRIRAAARVSRQGFHEHFDDVEDCFIAALEDRVEDMIARATRAKAAAASQAGGVYRAITAICDCVSSDPFLTRLCLSGDFPQGPTGRRARSRLVSSLVDTLNDGALGSAIHDLAAEASAAAMWSVFRAHALERTSRSGEIAATLSYLALAPSIEPAKVLTAISAEQHG